MMKRCLLLAMVLWSSCAFALDGSSGTITVSGGMVDQTGEFNHGSLDWTMQSGMTADGTGGTYSVESKAGRNEAVAVTITSPTNGATFTTSTITLTYSGQSEEWITNYYVKVDGQPFIDLGTATSYTTSSLADGSHTLSVKAKNRANVESATKSVTATISTGGGSSGGSGGGSGSGSTGSTRAGGGGGGGGGDTGGGPTSQFLSDGSGERVTQNMTAGVEEIFRFSSQGNQPLDSLLLVSSIGSTRSFVEAKAVEMASIPFSESPNENVMQYFDIETNVPLTQILKGTAMIKANKIQLLQDNTDAATIEVYQLIDGTWIPLGAVLSKEDETDYYYQVPINHFSSFVMTGGPKNGSLRGRVAVGDFGLADAQIGVPHPVTITVKNNQTTLTKVRVQVQIAQSFDVSYFDEEEVELLGKEEKKVEFVQNWTPAMAGSNVITVKILSEDKSTVYDTLIKRLDLSGGFRYDVIVECPIEPTFPGTNAELKITATNFGDYYQDVDLGWSVVDPQGNTVQRNGIPVAIRPKQAYVVEQNVRIPQSSPSGVYTAIATVRYSGENREGQCTFNVPAATAAFLGMSEAQVTAIAGIGIILVLFVIGSRLFPRERRRGPKRGIPHDQLDHLLGLTHREPHMENPFEKKGFSSWSDRKR